MFLIWMILLANFISISVCIFYMTCSYNAKFKTNLFSPEIFSRGMNWPFTLTIREQALFFFYFDVSFVLNKIQFQVAKLLCFYFSCLYLENPFFSLQTLIVCMSAHSWGLLIVLHHSLSVSEFAIYLSLSCINIHIFFYFFFYSSWV